MRKKDDIFNAENFKKEEAPFSRLISSRPNHGAGDDLSLGSG